MKAETGGMQLKDGGRKNGSPTRTPVADLGLGAQWGF